MSEKKVWFITGTSSGFGRVLAEEVLAKGDKVIATARKPEVLQDLIEKYPETARAIKLDVTLEADSKKAFAEAVKEFGRIDVLVNNAGYALFGAVEEVSAKQAQDQFDTNFFGVLNVTREALPIMRAQKSGYIVNISSLVGFSGFPLIGLYSATKFALEGVTESLAAEVEPFGIKTMLVEPGPFNTGFGSALNFGENELPELQSLKEQFAKNFEELSKVAGDPRKAVRIIIEAVESENPPFRLPLGSMAFDGIDAKIESVKKDIAPWRTRAIQTNFDTAATV